ncbi:glycoside hydrolase family 32 protein [Clostridiaceae bacterium]|nr:glycoside hydrolase family 32 protein [Clostridiaceae bacterium]RKI08325.1 glycoside hydrolase family 32 protein [bacterium 1XD21-70]
MTSPFLQKARKYEETYEKNIKKEDRPEFHLSPRVGWMNDPNGFSFYNGQYHLFYQYYPYDSRWGLMHWGHAVSSDLLHWTYLPASLAPDEAYDKDGCFSGSATVLPDGRHLLMYTGVAKEIQKDGSIREVQRQCIAAGDGINYEKYEKNPVLTEVDLPEGSSRYDFRDPKIWQGKDGDYYAVIGSRPADGSGQILLFKSPDGFEWRFQEILCSNRGRYGKMWECPDFFELDGKQLLLVSPQDMLPQGFEYHNGNGTVCIIGSYDEENKKFVEERNQAIDYGIDFYAPQTLLTADGRRIMIGWLQNWDACLPVTVRAPWFGQMSLPRELSVKDGRLFQKPVRELETLRKNEVRYMDLTFTDILQLSGVSGRTIDMELSIRPVDDNPVYQKFAVRFAQDATHRTAVSFRPHESLLKIDRKFSGSRRAFIHQRRSLVRHCGGRIRLRLILDRFSAELFVNDGEQVLSVSIQTPLKADGISFFCDGLVNMDIVKYDLA